MKVLTKVYILSTENWKPHTAASPLSQCIVSGCLEGKRQEQVWLAGWTEKSNSVTMIETIVSKVWLSVKITPTVDLCGFCSVRLCSFLPITLLVFKVVNEKRASCKHLYLRIKKKTYHLLNSSTTSLQKDSLYLRSSIANNPCGKLVYLIYS